MRFDKPARTIPNPHTFGYTVDGEEDQHRYGNYAFDMTLRPLRMISVNRHDYGFWIVARGAVVFIHVPDRDLNRQIWIEVDPRLIIILEREVSRLLELNAKELRPHSFEVTAAKDTRGTQSEESLYGILLTQSLHGGCCLTVAGTLRKQSYVFDDGLRELIVNKKALTRAEETAIWLEVFRRWLKMAFPLVHARRFDAMPGQLEDKQWLANMGCAMPAMLGTGQDSQTGPAIASGSPSSLT